MPNNPLCVKVEKAISQVVANFQNNPERFWNERDIHWSLFYYLKREQVSEEAYPTELIRAEFPTLKTFGSTRPSRGYYDLAILDAQSYNLPEVQNMKAQAPWGKYLELVKVAIAIEIKLWQARLRKEDIEELTNWDIQKLTDTPNNVKNAYFLNFVQLNFKSQHMKDYYHVLREYLSNQKKKRQDLNILCVPSEPQVQPVSKDNWL